MESMPPRHSSGRGSALGRIACWSIVAALGLLQAWAHRNAMNPDGISYLEIGRAGISGWQGFVNAYWSPLYPVLLSMVFRCFDPSSFWEFPAAHFLNFAIYLAGYGCLQFLIMQFRLSRRLSLASAERKYLFSDEELSLIGTILFLWTSRYWLGTVLVSPDLLVLVVFCLATAMLLRIRDCNPGWLNFALLGVVLGLGYLAKAPMFLLGFVFVLAAYGLVRDTTHALLHAAVALLFFLMIAVPFVIALSHSKHRFTFSDSSTISYAEYINQMPLFVGWQGEIPGGGTPAHPTRQRLAEPPLFEFATPVPGSYPPWYDPSYWYEGMRAQFSLRGELRAIFRGANEYLKMFSRSAALWCVLFALIWVTRHGGGLDSSNRVWWPVFLPALAAFLLFSLVHAETRFVAGAGLVLVFWVLSRVQAAARMPRKSIWVAKLIIFLAPSVAVAWSVITDLRCLAQPQPFVAWEAAKALRAAGLPIGAKVGHIGAGLEAYWAHLAQLRIIAEIPDAGRSRYAALDSEAKQAVLQNFARTGALAVVTRHAELTHGDLGWQRLAGTDLFVLIFAHPEPTHAPRASENYP
jgi:4-amino-4-deoxy-L-arabinose transferase-like glycosyltransferase